MSLMEREEFGIKKIIQELQEAVDLGDAPKRGPFAVFVRKEYLVETIAKLRDYQALKRSDTRARLAAIKDIPTERVIALAQAEAAGLVSILASAAEGAHPDNHLNEPMALEELRKMDGQPVWYQHDDGVGYWVLVTVRASKVVVRDQYGMTADVEVWMKRGERYYRRPPMEA